MKIIPGLLCLLLIGCADNKTKEDKQTLDFGSFSIITPNGWAKVKAQGTDSYVGRIAIDKADTIDFDLGWYSNTLTEPEPQIIERSMLKNMDVRDTIQFVIVDSRKGIDPDNFKKNNVSWDTIDGRKAKIIFPRQSGVGTTGIYIDSLWQAGSGIDRFNLYGDNLKPANEKLFLEALKTLKFHKTN
ncbi:hypothetical protein A4D02_28460 [Niastella koreensis]|uniref:Lipoprotein n=2 Tax=Niastella koreensis TaxID=354356 RepID=G8T8J5_NIAKG|nr:hypothetical protein [Niastella koreensis]AEW00167.1 hypothetical protein Niako_3881 [Niastella koreensis GR20-10]OQP49528.1 hypothetical protein A4D02_28460 [Niastella koreensis]